MPVIDRIFNGRMNLDLQPYRLSKNDYSDALNITRDAQGEGQDEVISNIIGNQSVSFTLPVGVNKTIGNYIDRLRNRQYVLRWNSNDFHTISYYDKGANTIVKVLENLTDSNGVDILGFDPSWKINHIDIIYDDENGDIVFWTDGLNPPSNINVKLATTGGYGVFQRSFINTIKNTAQIPPAVTYEDDATVTVNNLRKRLFRTKCRFVYVNGEKSVWSAISEVPLPVDYTDSAVDKDPTKNARIAMVLQTGAADVVKIEIAFSQSLGNVFSDFFLVKVIDKVADNINDNDITVYRFYNNEAYIFVDLKESILPFDFVPQKAYTQALPNGNVICYAAITEGYNISTVSGSAASASIPEQTTQLPFIFVASQSGDSGFGSGDIHIIVIGSIETGDVFNIYTSTKTVSYTAILGDDAADVITGLSADAVTEGFTVVSSDSENLVITQTNESLQRVGTSPTLRPPSDSFVWDYKSSYKAALAYFDSDDRSIGAQTTSGFSVQTSNYSETLGVQNISQITLSITSRPPIHAHYFHVLFTKNLTKSKLLYWVSDRTYKDTEFAYIGIQNLTTFATVNPNTPLGYDFLAGDRITFIKSLSDTPNTIYTNFDFEIQGEVNNPIINGLEFEGRYLKISLPATSATFDFGTSDFFNYFIELYTPAQSVANGLDVYYEIGQRYAIGNPGTVYAYHQGMLQNQTSDLITPATFEFKQGDNYYRHRTIKTGGDLNYVITAGERSAGRHTLGVDFIDRTFTDANITTGDSPLDNLSGWTFADPSRAIITMGGGASATTFRAKGTINVNFNAADTFSWFFVDNLNNVTYAVFPRLVAAGGNVIAFDCTFQLTAGQFISFLGWSEADFGNFHWYSQTDFTISIENPYTVGIVDPNFSDFFSSAVNSYGRPWTVDENAAQLFYPTLIRFGQEYQQDTSINQINRFYDENQDTYDRSYGSIKKLFVEKRLLYVFHEFDIGVVPVLTQIVKDTAGNPLEANSDILLNKISYPYVGKFGIGNVPESFAYGKYAKYGVDNNKGVVWRLSQDGITVLSVTYKTNSFFVTNLAAYKTDLNNGLAQSGEVYTGDPTVYGVFDSFTNKYIVALEEINRYDYVIDAPDTACTAVLDVAGILPDGTYTFRVSFIDGSGNESALSPVSNEITLVAAGAGKINLSNIPIGGVGIVERRIYGRSTTPTTDTDFLLSNTINDNSTTTLTGVSFPTGSSPSPTTELAFHQDPYTLSFLETRNESEGFESKLSYHPENMGCLDNLLICFKDGVLWKHDSDVYNNFFGVQYDSYITGVFNDYPIHKKSWVSMTVLANTKWDCPEIESQLISYGAVKQESILIDEDFASLEGQYSASFLKDSNSIGGLLNGDTLKGNYIIIKFRKQAASEFVFLNGVSVFFNNSQLNKI